MISIPCPHCGARDYPEFTYGGDAHALPPHDEAPRDAHAWADAVYFRDNPRGLHWELWQHSAGCRQWLAVLRDTYTHDVLETLTIAAFRARQATVTKDPTP